MMPGNASGRITLRKVVNGRAQIGRGLDQPRGTRSSAAWVGRIMNGSQM